MKQLKLKLEPVASSNIKAVGYDAKASAIVVEFNNGRVFEYLNAPPTLYAEFMEAKSKGKFLATHIIIHLND